MEASHTSSGVNWQVNDIDQCVTEHHAYLGADRQQFHDLELNSIRFELMDAPGSPMHAGCLKLSLESLCSHSTSQTKDSPAHTQKPASLIAGVSAKRRLQETLALALRNSTIAACTPRS